MEEVVKKVIYLFLLYWNLGLHGILVLLLFNDYESFQAAWWKTFKELLYLFFFQTASIFENTITISFSENYFLSLTLNKIHKPISGWWLKISIWIP